MMQQILLGLGGADTFIAATGGNSVTTDGNFKVHTFLSPGNFSVSQLATGSNPNNVEYLVIAGGGGGGSAHPIGTGGTGGPGIVIIRYKFQ